MDDKGGQKPLRHSSNAKKDIFNVYGKVGEQYIPIKDLSGEKSDGAEAYDEGEDVIQVESEDKGMHEATGQLAELGKQIQELTNERDELKDRLMRTAAELENVRRRSIREKQEMLEYANERLLFKMLELLDDLGNAIEAGKKTDDAAALHSGIELINQKAEKLFADAGVKRMESPVGKPFDVEFHDAIMHMPSELPEGNVVHEVQAGYMINDKVLRHARVVTSAGQPNQ